MASPLTLDSIVRAGSRQASTQLGEEVMILGMDAGEYFSLDEVGTRIWELLGTPVSVRDLCTQLQREYEVSSTQCEEEVLSLLRTLQDVGLLDVAASGA